MDKNIGDHLIISNTEIFSNGLTSFFDSRKFDIRGNIDLVMTVKI